MADQPDPLREFMIAAHSDLDAVKAGLQAHPEWLDLEYNWGEQGGTENALGAAAHMGNRHMAEYLLGAGAALTPTAAAMLGMKGALEAFIDADPANVNAPGAHGIPMLSHAALSGDVAVLELLKARGNNGPGYSMGLISATSGGYTDVAAWMLDNGADITAQNFQGKTALEIAKANGHDAIVALIEAKAT